MPLYYIGCTKKKTGYDKFPFYLISQTLNGNFVCHPLREESKKKTNLNGKKERFFLLLLLLSGLHVKLYMLIDMEQRITICLITCIFNDRIGVLNNF